MIRSTGALKINNIVAQNVFIYSTSITLALLLAYLSFHYYEGYFLKLKDRNFAVKPSSFKMETT
jgi:peptidoglycan/LPS O-acetylase OafA/YrhL